MVYCGLFFVKFTRQFFQCKLFFELSNDQCTRNTGARRLYGNSCSAALIWGKAHKESSSRKHNQKAPEDMSFIREKTYTLPITLARGLRIRARTKKRKKRRTEKPGGVPTHSRRSFPFQGTLGPQANCRSGPKKKSRHHEVDVSSGTQLFSRSTWEAGLEERDQERHH